MKQFYYSVYLEQEELESESPSVTGRIFARDRAEALDKINRLYPHAYYCYAF